MLEKLTSTEAVIDALGGAAAVMDLMGGISAQRLSNWRTSGKFPSNTYLLFHEVLTDRGFSAPYSLWQMADRRGVPKFPKGRQRERRS